MKLVLTDRVKHRVVGLSVILSVIAIFLPAILKRTNQPFDNLSRVSVRLPPKPNMPEVKMAEQAKLFNSVKTVKVQVRALPKPIQSQDGPSTSVSLAPTPAPVPIEMSQTNQVGQEASISKTSVLPPTPEEIKSKVVEKVAVRPAQPEIKVATGSQPASAPEKSNSAKNTGAYTLQVASFSNVENANVLIQKLKSKGFQAHFAPGRYTTGQKSYRVLVGRSGNKEDLLKLQQKIASQMKIQGFVVPAQIG